jgi:aryl-alcohol dehydrogenase-like predicted oxidoreductase
VQAEIATLGASTSDPLSHVRILNGLWQVSGAHGAIDPRAALAAMHEYHDAGFTTWDLADHYGPAEDFIGEFRRQLAARRGPGALKDMQAFTKWVPNPGPLSRQTVENAVNVSLRRMDTDRLDLLQFHWWEYSDPRYLDGLRHLAALRDEGRIRQLALTNFDTAHLERILAEGIAVVSNQVQYSLVDMRPDAQMAAVCQRQGVQLLTYGTLCGGLLTDRFLGQPEPARAELNTASLQKYKRMIDAWGSWDLFQQLLRALREIADKHGVSIANVAVRAILDRPAVGGVIVGARLGVSEHIADNERVFALRLDAEDNDRIATALRDSRDLLRLMGDCGDEYRR